MSKMAQLSNLPQDWDTSNGGFPESSIPNWQEAIPKSQDIADNALVRLFKEEWFTSLRVEVCVCPKERSERPYLIPPNQHFRVWVSEETSNVSYQIHGFVNLSGILCEGEDVHPAKLIPAILLDKTIFIPTAICSQVPRLSPVHIAPKRWEPA